MVSQPIHESTTHEEISPSLYLSRLVPESQASDQNKPPYNTTLGRLVFSCQPVLYPTEARESPLRTKPTTSPSQYGLPLSYGVHGGESSAATARRTKRECRTTATHIRAGTRVSLPHAMLYPLQLQQPVRARRPFGLEAGVQARPPGPQAWPQDKPAFHDVTPSRSRPDSSVRSAPSLACFGHSPGASVWGGMPAHCLASPVL